MRRGHSLTLRLALVFSLVGGVAFACVGAYLYRALATQIIDRDDAELMRKAVRVRAELAIHHTSPVDRWREVSGVMSGNDEFGLDIRDSEGVLMVEANPDGSQFPEMTPVPLGTPVTRDAIYLWRSMHDYPVRGLALNAAVADQGPTVRVTVYQVARSRVQLMRAYRWKLLAAAGIGALAVGLLGFVALRAGMAPLRRMAAGTESVTFSSVALPIDPAQLPRELEELAIALQQMIVRLQEAYDRLSRFSSDLAHDFRTPIGNLLGQTQVALSSERTVEEYEALLASNVEEYERLSRMIENMLFLARADNARVALTEVELDLAAELSRQADYFELLADAKQITFNVDAKGAVTADSMLLRRAVSNLISNAVRHTPSGQRIFLTGTQDATTTRIEVANPGPGIPPEDLPKIFDRFFRGDPARSNSGESSGIGLAIVKTIMDLHRGSVQVESEPNGMTRFRLIFPR
ncbi:heavy metal sensor histidine kinase [Cupriavidus pampae]|uniref:Sensor protein n=1 Tax=Cupriavidus pampae TaxID=659251 RepID=A0ABN7YIC4_9BURK|nr:heavy metal sensor histidine kinase [Cupriavidus pampae]CAG9171687.1 Sensor protein CzcS [Cupriavidus pampae]